MSAEELQKLVVTLEEELYAAAEDHRFEYAATLREEIKDLLRDRYRTSERHTLGAARYAAATGGVRAHECQESISIQALTRRRSRSR